MGLNHSLENVEFWQGIFAQYIWHTGYALHQEDNILLELLDLVGSSNFWMLVANLDLENLSKPRLIN